MASINCTKDEDPKPNSSRSAPDKNTDDNDPFDLFIDHVTTENNTEAGRSPKSYKLSISADKELSNASRERLKPRPLNLTARSDNLFVEEDIEKQAYHDIVNEVQKHVEHYSPVIVSRVPRPKIISPSLTGGKAQQVLGLNAAEMAAVTPPRSNRTSSLSLRRLRSCDKSPFSPTRTLRSMSSKLSLIGSIRRKAPSLHSEESVDVTSSSIANEDTTPDSLATPPTIRKRRGKFRPLSVFTSASAFHPFDPFGPMDAEVPDQTDHQLDVSSIKPSATATDTNSIETVQPEHVPKESECEASKPAEAVASPLQQVKKLRITADFATLAATSPPVLGDHPALRADPFSDSCDSPLMTTTSTSSDIRRWKHQLNSYRDQIRSSSAGTSLTFPFANASIMTSITTAESSDSRTVGSRKLSSLFKSRSSSDTKASTPSTASGYSSPNIDRPDLERYLRVVLTSPLDEYSPLSPFPRHPGTGRGWKHRNLRCTNCPEEACAAGGETCCAYKACATRCEEDDGGTEGYFAAWNKVQEITKCFPYGKEAPTFMQCTECKRMVCPECCGVCPNAICGDRVCKKCKPMMWEECAFHRDPRLNRRGRKVSAAGEAF